ncbi:ChaN family lipoprotein [Nannocystaceae bacterium ST9]
MRSSCSLRALALLALLGFVGCKPAPEASVEPQPEAGPNERAVDEFGPWIAPLERDHPLVGTAWSPSEARAISRTELERRLAAARYVLLGETHDNPDHHRLQGVAIEAVAGAAAERRPAVAFEMLDPAKQAAIDAFAGEVDDFAEVVAWADSGWPAWSIYRPVFAATLAADLPIYAAELPRDETRRFMAEGLAIFDPDLVARFGLAQPLAPELQSAWLDEMFASHCDMVPREHLGGMVEIQRLRDARMADAMQRGAAAQGQAILVAGGGHVRDVGVPRLLRALEPDAAIVSVGFVAAQAGQLDPREYGDEFDVLVFTPDVEREDPCASFSPRQ